MTYCLGIMTRAGLVMASDSRTNAGLDHCNTARKMHTFVQPGERAFVMLSSGSLSCSQSVLTLIRREFEHGKGLAEVLNMYDAARYVGSQVRRIAELDRPSLEHDNLQFNVHFVLGGQVKGEPPTLYLIYPQGNPMEASPEAPFVQIGETKYGRPILDRGIHFERTTLEEACKYALLSIDSTMKSNVSVGPPIDLLVYHADELTITSRRRFTDKDPDFAKMGLRWQQSLRQAVQRLPNIRFKSASDAAAGGTEQTIEFEDPPADPTAAGEGAAQAQNAAPAPRQRE